MIRPHRNHPLWYAFLLHRISGLVLALFLPLHFFVLSQAMTDPAAFDRFLTWTDMPLVKAAEVGLVFLLAVHMFGGLRLLVLELTPWQPWQKGYAAAAAALAVFVSGVFFLNTV
jgi:fumarate reductase subunit D